MKKKFLLVLAAVCLMLSVIPFTAFADLGAPQFNDWYVVVGLDGYDMTAIEEYGNNGRTASVHIEPGVLLQVYQYSKDSKTYLLVGNSDDFPDTGFYYKSFINVTSYELDTKFIEKNKTVEKENGIRLSQEITGTVKADGGLILRQGPAQTFEYKANIPDKTEVRYQFTYKYGGRNWGYVNYNGTDGWICIDYVEAKTVPTTAAPTTASPSTTRAPETTESNEINNVTKRTAAETTLKSYNKPDYNYGQSSGDNTAVIIIAVLGIAFIWVIIAVVLIIAKNQHK